MVIASDMLAMAVTEADIPTVVLLTSDGSSVQDVASVLAALTRASVPVVQLAGGALTR